MHAFHSVWSEIHRSLLACMLEDILFVFLKREIYVCHARNYRKSTALVKIERTYPRLYHFTFCSCSCSQMYGMSLDRFGVFSLRLLV